MKLGRALLIAAGLVVLLSIVLPVWGMDMFAPQYPDGLKVKVYPGRLEGDLPIINVLNHYVGMRELLLEDFTLVLILPYLFGFIGIGLLFAGLLSKRNVALFMVAILLLTAVFGFVELRRNLVEYGTNLDPMAPLDLDPFVPPLMGEYTVWNFTMYNHFMAGTYLMMLASVLAFFGWRHLSGTPTGKEKTTAETRRPTRGGRSRQTQFVGLFIVTTMLLALGTAAEAAPAASALPGAVDSEVAATTVEIVISPTGLPTLKEALATVADGGTVRVQAGVYEGPIVVERGVTLMADGHQGVATTGAWAPVEIVGAGEEDLVIVKDGSSLIGITVRHTGTLIRSDKAAVRVFDHGSVVADNTIMFDTAHGMYIERGGDHVVRNNAVIGLDRQNYIDDRGNGLYLFDTEGNLVENNRFELARDAVYLQFAGGDVIVGNDITTSRYGIHSMFSSDIVYDSNRLFQNVIGSAFMYSHNMDVTNNLIADHTDHRGYGILLKSAHRNRLTNNNLVGNHTGLFFDLSDDNVIEQNIFAVNNMGVSLFSSSNRNRIVNNSFIGNRADTSLHIGRHSTIWATAETGGNYWDTYRGVDVDGYGFGTLPHTSAEPFSHLTRYNPELHAFYLSPAVDVLSWAERAFPLFRAPRAVDERPRVQPDHDALLALRHQLLATVGGGAVTRAQAASGGAESPDQFGVSLALFVFGMGLLAALIIRTKAIAGT